MFQVEKEDVWRGKEDQCICIPKISMVAMVLLVLRYICDFYFKAQVEFGSCPVPVFPLSFCGVSLYADTIALWLLSPLCLYSGLLTVL